MSVKDIIKMGFELTKTQSNNVPNHEDPGLTFESGQIKKGKIIKTCVLYADIRNSTLLSKTHSSEQMARLYTAFTKSMMNIAEYHGGVIRNIIGDRVMIVFPESNCFQNAIDTAVSINTVSSKIINRLFTDIEFKCGIGIDYGEKFVVKAGIPKQDKERANYKNLIWISNSANIASKLTDIANKVMIQNMFRVTYNPRNFLFLSPLRRLLNRNAGLNYLSENEPRYLPNEEIKEVTSEEFIEKFDMLTGGSLYYTDGNLIKFEKFDKKIITSAILVSDQVYQEYKKIDPKKEEFTNGWWKIQDTAIKEYTKKIYGCDMVWKIDREIV
ncbi:MAG: adenylate/guanylate cyclase domain-containing protein [Saprospiraceae bacterium]|nr:adenylate/guanylate cyclase domain-containing protein [Saprospiraceae bacterium]